PDRNFQIQQNRKRAAIRWNGLLGGAASSPYVLGNRLHRDIRAEVAASPPKQSRSAGLLPTPHLHASGVAPPGPQWASPQAMFLHERQRLAMRSANTSACN